VVEVAIEICGAPEVVQNDPSFLMLKEISIVANMFLAIWLIPVLTMVPYVIIKRLIQDN